MIGDISNPATASRMIHKNSNFFGPTAVDYRRQAYLKLEEGWKPATFQIWSDLHMWRKFLSHDDISCGSRMSFTNFNIAAPEHKALSLEERETINKAWLSCASNPATLDKLVQGLAKHVYMLNNDKLWHIPVRVLMRTVGMSSTAEWWQWKNETG